MIRLLKDAEVFSSAGEKIGSLDRVVIDPVTKKVSHIIVKEGILFSNSKVIPISYVELDGERIMLSKNAMELEDLPDYEEGDYVNLGDTNEPAQHEEAVYWYPPTNLAWWNVRDYDWYPEPKYVLKTRDVLPEGTIALEEGATVISKDGKDLGNIERIIVEPKAKRATHIVVSKGIFTKKLKRIPTLWITNVTEEKVYLSVWSDLFESLPDQERVP